MSIPLPPCPTEDSTDCWWDATVHGNGLGHSFVNYDGSWQIIEIPATEHLTGVSVTVHEDTGGYTPAEFHTFDWTTVPICTDAIADAGGVCWGEPVSEGPSATTQALAETGPEHTLTPDVGIGIAVILVVGFALARRSWARR